MQLTLHLTKSCNLRCGYCYYRDFAASRMTREVALTATGHALDEGASHLGVTFFGGEPLLARDLIRELVPEIESRCARRGVSVNFKIPTNGTLLDEDFVRFCDERAVFLSLSIDGDEAAHAARVGVDGHSSFEAARSALDLLARHATAFATYSVVTPANAAGLARSMEYLHGAGSRILITALDHGAEWTRSDLRALARSYHRLARFYVRETIARRPLYLSAFDSKIQAHVRPEPEEDTNCRAGLGQMSVAPDGTYFPCIQFVERPDLAIGHASRGIDAARRQQVFAGTAGDPACAGCAIASRCSHHCSCLSLQATGTLDGISPIACEHERVLTPIADGVARELLRRRAPVFVRKHYDPDDGLRATLESLAAARKE